MNDATIIHLQGSEYDRSEIIHLGSASTILVVEAPDSLISSLNAAGAVQVGESVARAFREHYYETLDACLRLDVSGWGRSLSPSIRSVVQPSALPIAARTWVDMELLLRLGELSSNGGLGNVKLVTDSGTGLSLAAGLTEAVKALGRPRVELMRVRGDGTSLAVRQRHYLTTLQDAVGARRGPRTSQAGRTSPRVVLYTDSPRAWGHLRPIHRQLVATGVASVVLTSRGPMSRRLRHENVPVIMPAPRPFPIGFRSELQEKMSLLPFESGLSFPTPAAAEALRRLLAFRTLQAARRIFALRRAVRDIVRRSERVCFVHASYADATGGAVTWEANACGRPTALVPHGLIDHTRPELRFFPPADLFLAWGELMREDLQGSELPETTAIVAAGWPYLEYALRKGTAAAEHGGPRRPRTVLVVFGRPSRVLQRQAFEAAAHEVFRAAAGRCDLEFLIKVHPADTSGYWPMAAADLGLPNVEVVEGGDLHAVLGNAWIVITRHSTAGAEAICAGKPLVVVDIQEPGWEAGTTADYVSAGAAYMVTRSSQLMEVIAELEASDDREDRLATLRWAYARRFLTTGPQSAAERIAALLEDLASSETDTQRLRV